MQRIINIKVENSFDEIWGTSPKKKVNIKDENSFDQIWRTSPKEKSTSMLKIILIKYGEFLLHHQNKKST